MTVISMCMLILSLHVIIFFKRVSRTCQFGSFGFKVTNEARFLSSVSSVYSLIGSNLIAIFGDVVADIDNVILV